MRSMQLIAAQKTQRPGTEKARKNIVKAKNKRHEKKTH